MTMRTAVVACTLLLWTAPAFGRVTQGPPPPPPPPPPPNAQPQRDLPFRAPVGGGSISGKVMTADQAPTPVRKAIVTLKSDAYRIGWTRVTDETGAFSFNDLPAGRYNLAAEKGSWVKTAYGALRPGRPGSPIALADNGIVSNLTLTLLRGAAITGVVRDVNGGPIESARVTASLITTKNGARATTAAGGSSATFTDDRGEYRLYGLAPGDYAVSVDSRFLSNFFGSSGLRISTPADIEEALKSGTAAAPGATPVAKPREAGDVALSGMYFPGTARLDDAQAVKVAAGEERRGVDIQLEYVPTVSIEGRILDPDGKPSLSVTLSLLPADGGRSQFGRPSPANGTFSFTGITPGRYFITARATSNNAAGNNSTLYAKADIDVTGTPIRNINLTLKEGVTVSGTVTSESFSGTTPTGTMRVALAPILAPGEISLSVPGTTTATNGVFSLAGVTPGRYRISVSSNLPVWAMQSAVAGGREAIDDGFDVGDADVSGVQVKMTDQVSQILGVLQDATGRPAPDYYVIVFPADQKFWFQGSRRIKTARPGSDGKYIIPSLPPGEYRIAAVTDVETNEWFEPSFLQQLVGASAAVTLAEGERKQFPLKIGSGEPVIR